MSDGAIDNAGKTYDYPEGRLMKIPLAEAWNDD